MSPKHFIISARVKDDQFVDICKNQINFYGTPEFGDSFIEGEKAIYTDSSRYFNIKLPKTIDGDFTIYFWVKIVSNTLSNRWACMQSSCDSNFFRNEGFDMFSSSSGDLNSNNYFLYQINWNYYYTDDFYTLNNTWTNYCATAKNGVLNIYINGKKYYENTDTVSYYLKDYVGFAYYNIGDNIHRRVTGYYDDIVVANRCLFDREFTPPNHYLFPDIYKIVNENKNIYAKTT